MKMKVSLRWLSRMAIEFAAALGHTFQSLLFVSPLLFRINLSSPMPWVLSPMRSLLPRRASCAGGAGDMVIGHGGRHAGYRRHLLVYHPVPPVRVVCAWV